MFAKFQVIPPSNDPEEQSLAPKFQSSSADVTCREGEQVIFFFSFFYTIVFLCGHLLHSK